MPVDGKADVYSLALVLVEAVTGRVPFAADTTVATLMGRLDTPLEAPPELGPLGPVVARAGRPDPAERLDAMAFAAALQAVAPELPTPEPLPLAGPATFDLNHLAALEGDPTDLGTATAQGRRRRSHGDGPGARCRSPVPAGRPRGRRRVTPALADADADADAARPPA